MGKKRGKKMNLKTWNWFLDVAIVLTLLVIIVFGLMVASKFGLLNAIAYVL